MVVKTLGDSVFNYKDYPVYQFIHYLQQICHVTEFQPKKILEIGPGDHCVTDFLRRKGFEVKTFDADKKLYPDYLGNVKEPLKVDEKFDLVLASHILEHMNIKWLNRVLNNIKEVLAEDGHLVVSLPYSTVRLFPEKCRLSNIVSYNGRVFTYIPFYCVQPFLTLFRGISRIMSGKYGLKEAFRYYVIPEYPDDRVEVHHWDVGCYPTTRRAVREIFSKHFKIVKERRYINTNCIFFILKKV